jgi:hypothetical protein
MRKLIHMHTRFIITCAREGTSISISNTNTSIGKSTLSFAIHHVPSTLISIGNNQTTIYIANHPVFWTQLACLPAVA